MRNPVIPSPAHPSSTYAARLLLVVALGLVHLLVLLQLFHLRSAPIGTVAAALQVRFLPSPDVTTVTIPTIAPTSPIIRKRQRRLEPSNPLISTPATPVDVPHKPAIDWMAEARRSAVAATREPSTYQSLGGERPEPLPQRKQKPFGWDKTRTQRVEELPQGGILVRLNDNCVLVLTPLPMPSCSLGKRNARGDLFEQMHQPAQPGDWKDEDLP